MPVNDSSLCSVVLPFRLVNTSINTDGSDSFAFLLK